MKQPFSQAGGGGGEGVSSSPCFARTMFLLNFAGTTRGKQGQQLPYKLMTQDKDRGPLQFSGTAVPYAYE